MARRALSSSRIEALNRLSREELKLQWSVAWRRQPPPGASRELLVRSLAYRLQEQACGGLDVATRKELRRLARQVEEDGRYQAPRQRAPRAGTRFVRDWHGDVHTVTALETGFEYQGRHYASLSQIAREITGTRWNGPAFFGLRKKKDRGRS